MFIRRFAFSLLALVAALACWLVPQRAGADSAEVIAQRAAHHWSFAVPVSSALPPNLKHADWVRNPIDAFVLTNLETHGLAPAAQADRCTLIRRASLDLTGLPPTPAEMRAFVDDASPDAYEKLLDRLLASPHFGERWARVWLDLARYADSRGYGSDPLRMTIHRYRDWVIEAFNRDLPYNQFAIEQIAGDLLPNPTTDQLIATGFNRNTMTNTEGGTDAEEFRVAAVKDRVDTTLQVFMGLTMGCAQCHNHKYDPISNKEYYQLYAIFNQSEDNNSGDESPTMPAPSSEQLQSMQSLQQQIAQVEQQMKDPARVAGAQGAWEAATGQQLKTDSSKWTTLLPASMSSSGGATLTAQPDGSIIATGKLADQDTYRIDCLGSQEHITAFRIEALSDATLPQGGPGRAADGVAVINTLQISAAPAHASRLHGRYVRVENEGPQRYVHLAEVQVLDGATDLALAGKATQSSTAYGGDAHRAIDGNTDGEYFRSNSVSHTAEQADPWWEVDLGAAHDFDRIVIWNRTDGGTASRLSNGKITVFDEAHKPVWQTAMGAPPNPSAEFGASAAQVIALTGATDSSPIGQSSAARAISNPPIQPGWRAAPANSAPSIAVFQTVADNVGSPQTQFTFTIAQQNGQHALGHFRLSATTQPRPVRVLPDEVSRALSVAADQRSAQQKQALQTYYQSIAPELEMSRQQIARLKTQLDAVQPYRTAIMRDLPPERRRECRMLVKGNFMTKGDVVAPAVPASFGPAPSEANANRLTLAHYIAGDANPLTARVAVNRFWGQIFGVGIVETQEDFGTQGTPPVNQPLLDWMAVDFMQHGWDVKRLLKTMLTSATYQQVSRVTPEVLTADPHNRWNSRGPRQRLEAELVRDQALALSGLLSPKMFGPSVYPPQPPNLWQAAFNGERTYPTSTGEDKYRRGLYVFWRRTTPYPSMAAFDAPSREVCTMRRIPTSTPLQAFVTLNDPVYVECAQALGRRIVKEGGADVDQRLKYGLELCLCRPPSEAQIGALKSLYMQELSRYQSDPVSATKVATDPLGPLPAEATAPEMAAWTVTSNVLLNLDGVLTKN